MSKLDHANYSAERYAIQNRFVPRSTGRNLVVLLAVVVKLVKHCFSPEIDDRIAVAVESSEVTFDRRTTRFFTPHPTAAYLS